MNDMDITRTLIERAYKCAKEKGFHDKSWSVEHYLMLVVSEIGEAVEADRKVLHSDVERYLDESKFGADVYDKDTRSPFEKYIKDTVEDELSDVCIRLYDMCGALGVEPRVEYDDMGAEFVDIFGDDTFCERMYYLSRLLCSTSGVVADDGTDECLPTVVGSALSFLFALAYSMSFDLMLHIELKMRYNDERPYKNGKKY